MLIRRYFTREVMQNTLVIVGVLLVIFILNQFVIALSKVSAGDLTLRTIVQLIVLQLPELTVYLSPLGVYLAIFMVIGRWCVDHELVVTYASGVSPAQYYLFVLRLSCMAAALIGVLVFFVVPYTHQFRLQVQQQALAQMTIRKVMPQRFQALNKNGSVLYAASPDTQDGQLKDVFVAQRQSDNHWSLVLAKSAVQKTFTDSVDPYLIFNQGVRYVGTPGQADYEITKFSQYGVLLKTPSLKNSDDIDLLPTGTLWHMISTNRYAAAEWQWRFTMPLATLVMALLAVPLAQVNPRQGKYGRIVPAIIVYALYVNLLFVCRSWIEGGGISPALGMWWVHGLFACIAVYAMGCHLGWWPNIWRGWWRWRREP